MKAQDQALVESGKVRFGRWSEPLPDLNLDEADAYRLPGGLPMPRPLQQARLKEWQAFQFTNGRWFGIVALFNAKVMALAQLKLIDTDTLTKYTFEKRLTPWSLRYPQNLLDGEVHWSGDGADFRFGFHLSRDEVDVAVSIPATADRPAMSLELRGDSTGQEPVVVSIPFSDRRGMYSHKACMPATGTLTVGEEEFAFQASESALIADDHRGYYPRVMEWDWGTAAYTTSDGTLIGLNLTRNASIDPERYNENVIWVGGHAHALPAVTFVRHDTTATSPERWEIRDQMGRVNVDLDVLIDGRVDINAVVLKSKYRGPFGRFSGTITLEDGSVVEIPNVFGMGEDFELHV